MKACWVFGVATCYIIAVEVTHGHDARITTDLGLFRAAEGAPWRIPHWRGGSQRPGHEAECTGKIQWGAGK